MNYFEQYVYCDAQYDHPGGGKSRWLRIRTAEVQSSIFDPGEGSNCFTSIQRFKDSTTLRDGSEGLPDPNEGDKFPDQQLHYQGLYFDFDCDATKAQIDEDEAFARVRAEAVAVASFFLEVLDLAKTQVQVWFSGRRGFHVVVRPEVFGIKPHRHLTYIMQKAAQELKHRLNLTTLDMSVYTISRMWRIPNSTHAGTGLHKIELDLNELKTITREGLMVLAGKPRSPAANLLPVSHVYDELEYLAIPINPGAERWWKDFIEQYEMHHEMKLLAPKRPIKKLTVVGTSESPVCMQDMIANGPKPDGKQRNAVLYAMVTFWRSAGIEKIDALALANEWTQRHFGNESNQLRDRIANAKSIIESSYRSTTDFVCNMIRSCGPTSGPHKVACVTAELCPWIQNPSDQEPQRTPRKHLSEASRAEYIGKLVEIPVQIASIEGTPYAFPTKGKAHCTPDDEAAICKECPMKPAKGEMSWTFSATDRDVLKMLDVNDARRKGVVKARIGIPIKCFKHRIEEQENGNAEVIQMIPMVDHSAVIFEDGSQDNKDQKASRHVMRQGYYLGHGIETNKKYIISAYVYAHPETQAIVFQFEKAEPAKSDIDQFKMTPEIMERLKIFRREPGQSVKEKFDEIHEDLESNVYQMGGRRDLAVGIDLCYHSAIGFVFDGKPLIKGWFELLVMGDSGSGKSTFVQRIMAHFGMGELVSGEESRRTGLIHYSAPTEKGWMVVWGKMPQNDRRILAIDEFAEMKSEELQKMTQIRSEGIARGSGVTASHETYARTRLIFLTNPKGGGALAQYNYGVEAVNELFDSHADCRRVDLAICCKTGDVANSVFNKRWTSKTDHRFTADLCQNLVRWAWSLESRDVVWGEGAEQAVFDQAGLLGQTYDCDIYLATPSDLREKIARVSVACAVRMFSTDAEGKRVIVEVDHVNFVASFFDQCYRKPAMGFFDYAMQYKQENCMTPERKDAITREITRFPESGNLIRQLRGIIQISKQELGDLTSYEKDELNRVWKYLVGGQLLRRKPKGGFQKSPAFTELCRELGDRETQEERAPEERSDVKRAAPLRLIKDGNDPPY